jgi:hypothetical protein
VSAAQTYWAIRVSAARTLASPEEVEPEPEPEPDKAATIVCTADFVVFLRHFRVHSEGPVFAQI